MGDGGGGVELLISETTGSVLDYPVLHTQMTCLFLSLTVIISSTQTLPQTKSQEFTGHIKQRFVTTSPDRYVRMAFNIL